MISFIYCIDESLKNELISKGYNLLKQESIQNDIWVFEFKPEIKFDITDKKKYFITNKLTF